MPLRRIVQSVGCAKLRWCRRRGWRRRSRRNLPRQLSDDLLPDGRGIGLIHDPLEFVGTSCFEQDTRDTDPDGRTGWDACIDVLDGGTIRERLAPEREREPIAAESVQPNSFSSDIDRRATPARSSSTHCTFTRSHSTAAVPSSEYTLSVRYYPRLRGFMR